MFRKTAWLWGIIFLIGFGFSLPVEAGTEEGLAALEQEDYETAFRELNPAAEAGDPEAQYYLGLMYHLGLGVDQDYIEALKWYQLAAKQDNSDAKVILETNLGLLSPQGEATAMYRWYRYAAEQGFAQAQESLGSMYQFGFGIDKPDYKEAIKWYRMAAEQGLAPAQTSLAAIYANGWGVLQDYKEAVKWYHLAAEQGYLAAQNNLGIMYEDGLGVTQDYKKAVKWYRLAAEQGYFIAQYNLGLMYFDGRGVPQDFVQAHMWTNISGSCGYKDAREARETIAGKMTPEQIAKAQGLAGAWSEKHSCNLF